MGIRARTRRRLLILLTAVAVAVVGVAGLYAYRQQQRDAQTRQWRAQGLEAYQQDHHREALRLLGQYHQRVGDDPEALYALARSRLAVERPDGGHLLVAMRALQQTLQADPDHQDAARELLDLYDRTGRHAEALELARRLLEDHPDDPELIESRLVALSGLERDDDLIDATADLLDRLDPDHPAYPIALERRVIALNRLGRGPEALEAADRLNERFPDRYTGFLTALDVRNRHLDDPRAMLAWAASVHQAHPDSPGHVAVHALAHGFVGDTRASVALLERAARLEPTDRRVVGLLANQLARRGRHELAADLLTGMHRRDGGAAAFEAATRQIALSGDVPRLLQWTDSVTLDQRGANVEVLGLRGMALLAAGRRGDAEPFLENLAGRTDRPEARAWADALRLRFAEDPPGLGEAIERLNVAASRYPNNPWIQHWLASTYDRAGETAAAIERWRRAVSVEPGWAEPHLRLANALRRDDRHREALPVARRAVLLAPRSVPAAESFVVAASHATDLIEPEFRDRMIALADRLLEADPDNPEALAARVRLLHHLRGPDAARRELHRLLAREEPLPPAALRTLFTVNRALGLGAEEALSQALTDRGGDPALAAAAAMAGLEDAGPGAIIERFEAVMRDGGHADDPAWLQRYAALLESLGDPGALDAWRRAVEADGERPEVLQAALESDAALNDPDFYADVIERLRDITGESGTTWKLAEARRLIRTDGSTRALDEANGLLREVVELSPQNLDAVMLLAELHRLRGDDTARLEQLNRALAISDRNPRIALALVEAYESAGRFDQAELLLDRTVPTLSPQDTAAVRRAASALVRLGELDRAITLLNRASDLDSAAAAALTPVLAELYERKGETEAATAAYERALDHQPTPTLLRRAIAFFARHGRLDRSRSLLDRLDEALDDPVASRLARAAFEERFGDPVEADRLVEAAAAATPPSPRAYRKWIERRLATGGVEAARGAIERAAESMPDRPPFSELASVLDQAAAHVDRPGVMMLLMGMLSEPEHAAAQAEAVEAIASAQGGDWAGAVADRITPLARETPSQALSLAAARLLIEAGRRAEAASFASERMREVEGASLAQAAATSWAALGRWDRVLPAAEAWNYRSAGGSLAAQTLIVRARGEQGRRSPRLEARLIAGLEAVTGDPQPSLGRAQSLALALLSAGRSEPVAEALRPMLQRDRPWRLLWLSLVRDAVERGDAAAAWIEAARPAMDLSHPAEAMALAVTLGAVAERFDRDGLLAEKLAVLDRGLASRPAEASLRREKALTLEAIGRLDEAVSAYEAVLETAADDVVTLNNLALLLADRGGDLDRAKTLIDRALSIAPGLAALHDTRGEVLAASGRDDEAVAAYRRAIEREPDELKWRLHLARHHAEHGRVDQARGMLREVETAVVRRGVETPADLRELINEVESAIEAAGGALSAGGV